MNYHKSADLYLRNRGLLRILEIGAGSGNYIIVSIAIDRVRFVGLLLTFTIPAMQQVPILNFSPQIPS
jgi:hypothetical protein